MTIAIDPGRGTVAGYLKTANSTAVRPLLDFGMRMKSETGKELPVLWAMPEDNQDQDQDAPPEIPPVTSTITHPRVTLKLCAEAVRLYDDVEDACAFVRESPTPENRNAVQYALRQYFTHREGCKICTVLAQPPERKR